ncbi:hypothetical protein ACFFX0_04380 [Citricoccus parietis]|uniref:Uncharacterized protein n=1 Tax=Citricoccus parietis TaxID=592307 RepID=A0ABV5FUW9_9MICC
MNGGWTALAGRSWAGRWTPAARYVDVPSHNSSSSPVPSPGLLTVPSAGRSTRAGPWTVTTRSTVVPDGWGLRRVAEAATSTGVQAGTGAWWTTRLWRWTMPSSGSGKSGSAMSSMAAGNEATCTSTEGRSAGSSTGPFRWNIRAYRAASSAPISWSWTTTVRPGSCCGRRRLTSASLAAVDRAAR